MEGGRRNEIAWRTTKTKDFKITRLVKRQGLIVKMQLILQFQVEMHCGRRRTIRNNALCHQNDVAAATQRRK